jgi:uncharacterized protein YndB with AHSA1/START domain
MADGRVAPLMLRERIRATPDEVFDFLVQADKLVRWMGVEARIDPTPGGEFWLDVTGGDIARGTYVLVDRPHRVDFSWGWEGSDHVPPGSSTVSFVLRADGDETIVELTHSGLPVSDDDHLRGWTYFLDRLVRAAAGEQLEPQDPGSA